MGKGKRLKVVQAGRLVYAVCYTQPRPSDGPKQREAKTRCSSAARKKLNFRAAWQKLELQLAANFTFSDLFVTLTFDDAHLPDTHAGTQACMRQFLRQFREHRQRMGASLLYEYTIERHGAGDGAPDRRHIHMVVNSTGFDYEVIHALWSCASSPQREKTLSKKCKFIQNNRVW